MIWRLLVLLFVVALIAVAVVDPDVRQSRLVRTGLVILSATYGLAGILESDRLVRGSDGARDDRRRRSAMQAMGADLRLVPSDGGKVTPALFERFE